MEYIAHIRENDSGERNELQSLEDHLQGTAEFSKQFAEEFDSSEWAYVLGMLHDLGKGTPEWKKYLESKSGFKEDASSENGNGKMEHAIYSVKYAVINKYMKIGYREWNTKQDTEAILTLNINS
jgi:CRISPR-associated endonuclease/helicase Cas3